MMAKTKEASNVGKFIFFSKQGTRDPVVSMNRPRMAVSIVVGVLVAAATLVLVLWIIEWFLLPKFLLW